jgi:hypothetical protein
MGLRVVRGPADVIDDDDRLLAAAPTRHVRWNLVLVSFMRILALVWLAKGLLAWAAIMGFGIGLPFEARSPGYLGRGSLAPRRHEPPHPRGVLSPLRLKHRPADRAPHSVDDDVLDYILARRDRRMSRKLCYRFE